MVSILQVVTELSGVCKAPAENYAWEAQCFFIVKQIVYDDVEEQRSIQSTLSDLLSDNSTSIIYTRNQQGKGTIIFHSIAGHSFVCCCT